MSKSRDKPKRKDNKGKPKSKNKKLPVDKNDPKYIRSTPLTERKGFIKG